MKLQLEAASEETEDEQHIRAVGEGFAQSLAQGLGPCRMRGFRRRRQRERERQDRKQARRECDECLLPAESVHQRNRDRRIEKLPERAGGGAETERERAVLQRHDLAKRGEHDRK